MLDLRLRQSPTRHRQLVQVADNDFRERFDFVVRRRQGISYKTACRWVKDDVMPVPWRQLATGTILVDVDESSTAVAVALYARVSSHDQRADLDRQLARLSTSAAGRSCTSWRQRGKSVRA
jgi:predicted site-specific integrase-resolvase